MNLKNRNETETLAVCGSAPVFDQMVPVGQLYYPSWESYEESFRAIFERQYYTNQGPLTEMLERQLEERLGVGNAICVTNATIGLSMLAEALEIKGRVIMPSFTFIATAQSLYWSNLTPIFCDVDPETHHLDFDQLEILLQKGADAILAVNLWGGCCDIRRLEAIAGSYGVPLYSDSAHGFGCVVDHRHLGCFGSAEVFSFHATKIMSSGEGGCITTNDDELAERLRNIRSSYGIRRQVKVDRTANGRMSEAQAAIGLLSLQDLDNRILRNKHLHEAYREVLDGVSGLKILIPAGVDKSNYQYFVCEVDEDGFGLSRDELNKALQMENIFSRKYFYPGMHRSPPFCDNYPSYLESQPQTDKICSRVIQLPLGARVDEDAVALIGRQILLMQKHSRQVRLALGVR